MGRVYLVGAGPGDPGLLTLRAIECLQAADFILYDYLTPPRLLDFASPQAEALCVSDLPGEHPQRWSHIHLRLIEEAKKGKTVVHLKGGDPLVFGRGGEEAEALRAAGIEYELVPGVTAAFGAGSYAEIPLTHRKHASAIAIITGHEHPEKQNSRIDWGNLAHFPGTLAVYMAVARLGTIAKELVHRGKPADTPVALVHRATTGDQVTVLGTLETIEETVRLSGVSSPALLIIGTVAGLKPEHSWFENLPLHGMRVLVTRPRQQALPFVRRLEQLGAVPHVLPILDVKPPDDLTAVDRAIEAVHQGEFDWIIFTSANGVSGWMKRLKGLHKDTRAFGKARIAVIGQATAEALAETGLIADYLPEAADSEHLVAGMKERCQGKRVLLAQAAEGRELLREQLSKVAEVETVAVYEQVVVLDPQAEAFDHLRRGEIQVVTLTSPNLATTFLKGCDETILGRFRSGQTRLLANSERLGKLLRERGFDSVVSQSPQMDGMLKALTILHGERETI